MKTETEWKELNEGDVITLSDGVDFFEYTVGGSDIPTGAYYITTEENPRRFAVYSKHISGTLGHNPRLVISTNNPSKRIQQECTEFLDYTILMSGDGVVIVKNHCNVMPGACNFGKTWDENTLNEAKKSATLLFMINRPADFRGSLYWKLTGRSGSTHEWYTLKGVCEREKITIPSELELFDAYNALIGFKGKLLEIKNGLT